MKTVKVTKTSVQVAEYKVPDNWDNAKIAQETDQWISKLKPSQETFKIEPSVSIGANEIDDSAVITKLDLADMEEADFKFDGNINIE